MAHTETNHLGHVKLYRDELEQIIRSVAEIGEPIIEGPEFTATSEQDLADQAVPEKLEWLTITASRGKHQLRVTLNQATAVVEMIEPDTLLRGVLTAVAQVCQRSLRRGRSMAPLGVVAPDVARRYQRSDRVTKGLLVFVLALATTVISLDLYLHAWMLSRDGLLMLVLIPVPLWILWAFRKHSSAVLINAYRAERPTFWQRKRDDLLINAVALVLGGVIGYFVNELQS